MDSYAVLAAALCLFHLSGRFTGLLFTLWFWSSSLELVAKAIFGARQKLVAATELGEDFKLGADLYV